MLKSFDDEEATPLSEFNMRVLHIIDLYEQEPLSPAEKTFKNEKVRDRLPIGDISSLDKSSPCSLQYEYVKGTASLLSIYTINISCTNYNETDKRTKNKTKRIFLFAECAKGTAKI